jgi:two-component system OmpR family response regulator
MNQHRRNTILIVEDEPVLTGALLEGLSNRGFHVWSAMTGEEAVEILWQQKERIDWLFTNVRLPGAVNGWRVAEEFRFAHPLRAVIFANAPSLDESRLAPSNLFFSKPYRPADVIAALERLSQDPAVAPLPLHPRLAGLAFSATEPKRSRYG